MARSALIRTDRYSRGAIRFHWIVAALVLLNLALGLLHESLLDGMRWVIPLHVSVGLSVLILTLGRIAWRLRHRPPPLLASMAAWERAAARASHFAFYVLMLALPLSGWAMRSAGPEARYPLRWFGLFDVPHLPVTPQVADAGDGAHLVLGYAMAALVVLHVAAALRHHFLLRDAVLARMVPGLPQRE